MPQQTIVFLGDSLTEGGQWESYFPDIQTINHGVSGDTTFAIVQRIHFTIDANPRKIFIMTGINDLLQGFRQDQILGNYETLLEQFKEKLPLSTVFVQSLLPIVHSEELSELHTAILDFNTSLKELAERYKYPFLDIYPAFSDEDDMLDVDFSTDGLHLNNQGYAVWQKEIFPYVTQ